MYWTNAIDDYRIFVNSQCEKFKSQSACHVIMKLKQTKSQRAQCEWVVVGALHGTRPSGPAFSRDRRKYPNTW